MTIETSELVWLEAYSSLAPAERARGFLRNRGISGAIVVDHTSPVSDAADRAAQGGAYDLMVAPAEALKALTMLADEDRIESELTETLSPEGISDPED